MHGGDIEGYREKYGMDPVDLSVNISPLGMPEGVLRAATEAVSDAGGYPDGSLRKLKKALADRYGAEEQRIFCSGGAADIIFRLAAVYRGKKALVIVPAFTEYERSLRFFGCGVRTYRLREDTGFLMTEDDARNIIEEIGQGIEIVFIGQPANPSGRVTDISMLERIADACDRSGALLVIDECFLEFVRGHEKHTLLGSILDHRMVLIRSFTKLYGMAGLRIGYCFLGKGIASHELAEAGQPWPVSNIAEAAAISALKCEDYEEAVREAISGQREYMKRELEFLGCRVIPSATNYILFYHKDHELYEKLAERGILIRDCSDQTGLGKGWYRVAAADDQSVKAFLEQIHNITH